MKKRVGIFAFITAMTITSVFGLVPVGTAGTSDSATIVTVKAAAKKGFVKKSGKWYYYKNGKKVTGLKKLSGKYYYFDKKGVMASGKKTISGFTYYFNKAKDGKAPALVSKSKKISGKTWYFSSTGRGFYDVGSVDGNKAVAKVMDAIDSKAYGKADTDLARLNVVYTYIDTTFTYLGRPVDLTDSNWIGKYALELAEKKSGKCFHFAALTGLCARGLGADATIVTGYGDRKGGNSFDETKEVSHAWVLIDDHVLDSNYDSFLDGQVYFYKTYDELKDNPGTTYLERNRY